MKNMLFRDFLRSLKKHLARFISIVAILALGVGFFAGINATEDDMILNANDYFKKMNLMDIKSFNPLGYSDDEINKVKLIDGVSAVEESMMADMLLKEGDTSYAVKVISYPERGLIQNKLRLKTGRMPEKAGEVLVDGGRYTSDKLSINSKIVLEQVDSKDGEKNPDTESGKILKKNEFTVVGIVDSPLYLSFERGQTNIGDGKIKSFIYIPASDFDLNKTNVLFIKITDSENLKAYSDEYKDKIQLVKEKIDNLGSEMMAIRKKDVLDKITDSENEYNKNKAEVDKKLKDALEKLNSAEKELNDGASTLEKERIDGQKKLDESISKLQDAEAQYQNGLSEYNIGFSKYQEGLQSYLDGKSKLDETNISLKSARSELDKSQVELAKNEKLLSDTKIKLTSAKEQLDSGAAHYEKALTARDGLSKSISVLTDISQSLKGKSLLNKTEFETFINQIDLINPELKALVLSKTSADIPGNGVIIKAIVDNAISSYQDSLLGINAKIKEYETALSDYKNGVKQYDSGLAALNQAKQILSSKEAQYSEGLAKYKAGIEELKKNELLLSDSKKTLDEAKEKLLSSRDEIDRAYLDYEKGKAVYEDAISEAEKKLSDGKIEYEKGKKEYEKNKKEADENFNDVLSKIEDAKLQAEKIPSSWIVTDRNGNPDYLSYYENAVRIGKIAKVFPLFFFIVAALVSLTTITRMVEEERLQVGTLKALGYSRQTISRKYIMYALLASVLGTVIGLSFGLVLFPKLIMQSYGLMYSIPVDKLEFNLMYSLISAAMAILTAVLSAYFAIVHEVKETPAALLMPAAPAPGKKILLESITPIWSRLSFSRKVTFRNLFRYKKRFIMTLMGISGCTALIFTGFGIKDSINGMVDRQFGGIARYELYTLFNDDAESLNKTDALLKEINAIKGVSSGMRTFQETVALKEDNSDKEYDITLVVPEYPESFNEYISLNNSSKKGETLNLSDQKVVISNKVASILNLKAGDSFTYQDSEHRKYQAVVGAITENYLNSFIYMSPDAYKETIGEDFKFNGAYINLDEDGKKNEEVVKKQIMDKEETLTVVALSSVKSMLDDQMESLNFVVVVLILSAGALAFIVLYNLSNVNITERIREIATLKVLGFRRKELNDYVFRENLLLTLIGALLGLLLGLALHGYIIRSVEIDTMTFVKVVKWQSYIYSVLLTILFSALVNRISYFTLRRIDIVESLKSVE